MTGRLEQRTALIIGGGAGIGAAAARLFAREGAQVMIADLDGAAAQATTAHVREAGGAAHAIATDVTQDASVRAAVATTLEHFGKLDTLFNCAGGSLNEDAYIADVDVEAVWQRTMQLDLKGTMLACHHAIPAIVQAGGGAIVNMSSGAALRGASPAHIYSAAKGGILSFTRALAGAYAKHNIRANAICAGRILTERILSRYGAPGQPGPVADLQDATGRVKEYPFWVGTPEDIANIALFLASNESRMITGASIAADGGRSSY